MRMLPVMENNITSDDHTKGDSNGISHWAMLKLTNCMPIDGRDNCVIVVLCCAIHS